MTTLVQGEVARGPRIVLREKRLGDAPADYRWRSTAELSRFDAARPLAMTYQQYLALYREELLYPSPYRKSLAIEDEQARHIGNIMYYNIDTLHREAELGITIGDVERWGQGYGSEAVRVLLEHLLLRLGFKRIYLKTLDWNERARRCFLSVGFAEHGRATRGGSAFVLMECRQEWLATPESTEDQA